MPRAPRPLLPSASAGLTALALASAALLLPATAARAQGQPAAQTPPPPPPASPAEAVLGTYKWRSIGPNRGGRSIAVSGVKGRPREAYFGAVGGGLWKTTDAGDNWAPVTDGQLDELVGRRGRRVRIEPRRRLHRHGRVVHPRQHHARRRRLQVHRRRQDLDATSAFATSRRSPRSASIRPTPTSSSSPPSATTAGRATNAACSRAPTAARPGRKCCSATARPAPSTSSIDRKNPERDVRGAVGGVSRRVPDVERRPGQRPLQVHRRRRARGPRSRATPACPRAWSAASASRSPAPTRTASTRWSRTRTAACSCPTTPARRGSW